MRAAVLLAALLVAACSTQPALPLSGGHPSPNPGAAVAAADAELWGGRWTAAERDYRRLADGGEPHALSHLALLLTYESRLVEAVADAQRAVQEQADADTYARLTRALDWSNDLPAAVAAGTKAVAAPRADALAYDFDAEALSDVGRFSDAEAMLRAGESAAANAYQRAEAAREWSNYYRDRGMTSDELDYVEIAQRAQPGFPVRTIELANEYAGSARRSDSFAQLDAVLKRWPHEPAVIAVAADAAFGAGDTADSERYYRAALTAAPGDPAASLGLAEIEVAELHDASSARAVLLTSLRAHPAAETVYEYLRQLDSLVLHIDPTRDSVPVAESAAAAERQAAYGAVNASRGAVRLPVIPEDSALAAAAQAHAYYVLFNWGRSDLGGLGIHAEDPGAPGFTGANSIDRDRHFGYPGYQSSEVINHTLTAAAAVEVWTDSVYHRFPILDRESTAVGFGEAQVGSLAVNVMDFGAGPPDTGAPIEYPTNGQIDVPGYFLGNEVPDPAPGARYPLGYPITVMAGSADALELRSATVGVLGGATVPVIIDRPGRQSLDVNELAVLPVSPLEPGAIYKVQLQGQLDGRPWSATWSFKVAA